MGTTEEAQQRRRARKRPGFYEEPSADSPLLNLPIRSESALIRRRRKSWHKLCRRTLGGEIAGRETPANADSRRRRWPKASVYRGLATCHNLPLSSVQL